MSSRTASVRVGLLLILGMVGAVGLVLFLARDQVKDGLSAESYFSESVQGLDVGAPVKFRGVTLGQVTEIALVTANYMPGLSVDVQRPESRLVVVRWLVDPKRIGLALDLGTAVDLGLRARLSSQGITGLAYIELDFVDPKRFPPAKVPWTPRDAYLPAMPSTMTQVQDAAQALAEKLKGIDLDRMVASVQAVLDDVHGQLSGGSAAAGLADLAALAHTMRTGAEAADLPGMMAELRATTAALRATLDGKETKALLTASAQAAERLAASTVRLPALIASLDATLKRANNGTSDVQAELIPGLRDAKAAAANLRETTETLRRYPASVLLGAPPPRANGASQ